MTPHYCSSYFLDVGDQGRIKSFTEYSINISFHKIVNYKLYLLERFGSAPGNFPPIALEVKVSSALHPQTTSSLQFVHI
jgi:hypothetical protein